jgi:putative ABC transport system permease protein
MILWRFTVREILNRPGRATLTLLSIVIGVAAVVAVTVSTSTTHEAYENMYVSMTGKANFEVVVDEEATEKRPDGAFFDPEIVKKLDGISGVASAVPSFQSLYELKFKGHETLFTLKGVDVDREGDLGDYDLVRGTFFQPGTKPEVLMEAGFAQGLGVGVGDKIHLLVQGNRSAKDYEFRVVGLMKPKHVNFSQQAGLVFATLPMAQRILNKPGKINQISIVLDKGAPENAVRKAIEAELPAGLTVNSPAARSPLARETLQSAEHGLQFAFCLSILLAVIMIVNTFLMNIGERRRQLAILRAIGTTRKQIVRMLLAEALTLGVLGTVFGCALGIGGAMLLTAAMSQIYSGSSIPPLHISPLPFILVGFLGPAIALAGALVPALLTCRITPIEGMRPIVSESKTKIPRWYVALTLVVFCSTGGMFAGCVAGWLPLPMLVPIGSIFTVAFVLFIPLVLPYLTRSSAFALRPLLGVEGQISGRQVLRRQVRMTLTIGILYVAVSTAVSMGTMIIDNVSDVKHWFDVTMKGDFILRSGSSLSLDAQKLMPLSVREEIRNIPGVKSVDTLVKADSYYYSKEEAETFQKTPPAQWKSLAEKAVPQTIKVVIFDVTDSKTLPLVLKEGTWNEVIAGLERGEAVLSTVLANRTNTHVGQNIALQTPTGPMLIPVAGAATSYMAGGKMLFMQGDKARKLFGINGVGTYLVRLDSDALQSPDALRSVVDPLEKIAKQQGVILYSFADLRGRLDGLLNGIVGCLWGLMALGFITGAFCMANTLSMNVLEQTRELALLRVVAMTRKQVRKTILAQAAIIGFIGLLTGTIGGLIGSYSINLCAIPLFGYAIDFAIHPGLLAICFFTGLAVILIAAWIPAERAARLNLLIALQYE